MELLNFIKILEIANYNVLAITASPPRKVAFYDPKGTLGGI